MAVDADQAQNALKPEGGNSDPHPKAPGYYLASDVPKSEGKKEKSSISPVAPECFSATKAGMSEMKKRN